MFSPRWRKVIRDLWLNKTRTLLVVLSIAGGVWAVGVIMTSQLLLSEQLNEAYVATNPTNALMIALDGFDEDIVEAVRNMPEVSAAEGRRSVYIRVKKGESDWQIFQLNALDDFDNITVDKVWPVAGKWPPGEEEIIIERSALGLLDAEIGDTLTIKDFYGKERQVRFVGTAQDIYAQMYTLQNYGYGYITFDTLEWLGEPRSVNDIRFTVANHNGDRDYIAKVSKQVQSKIEAGGGNILASIVFIPGQHPLNFIIQPTLALLGVFGLLALVLSAFLVVNMISALLAQQQKQIGVMKAIGARTGQIVGLYFANIFILGLLSLALAIPLGALGAWGFSQGMGALFKFNLGSFYIPPTVLAVQTVLAFVIPFLAAIYPIFAGTRITVQEAIGGYGLGKGVFGKSLIDRFFLKLQSGFLKRPIIISLRNTIRRKGRLALTLITLIMSGAIFVSVFSVQSSLQSTLDALLDYYRYDVAFIMQRSYRTQTLEQEILPVEGVANVEAWAFGNVRRVRPDNTQSENILVYSPPANTTLAKPTLVEGRWLVPEDQNAVVINTLTLNSESDLKVGDEIILKVRGRDTPWEIVGIVMGGGVSATMFVNYDYYSKILGQFDKASFILIKTDKQTPEFRKEVLTRLEEHLDQNGLRVNVGVTVDEDIAGVIALFAIIFGLLFMMALLLAGVGGLGLMGTMSINVLERTREMGVMRAIGAGNFSILQIVMVEGILIGISSWFISVLIAFPISLALSNVVGKQLLGTELSYTFSTMGAVIWLGAVIILSGLASFLPAWNASRITVQEVLAYE